jgi:SagB-type dehydrogenase family enzyme
VSLNDGGCLKSFLYHPEEHSIELFSVCQGSIRVLCNDQETAAAAIGLVTYVYNVQKNSSKYGARGLQFALIECGHAAQNLILAASDIGLGTRCIGAVDFEAASPAFNLLPDQMPIYAVALY